MVHLLWANHGPVTRGKMGARWGGAGLEYRVRCMCTHVQPCHVCHGGMSYNVRPWRDDHCDVRCKRCAAHATFCAMMVCEGHEPSGTPLGGAIYGRYCGKAPAAFYVCEGGNHGGMA